MSTLHLAIDLGASSGRVIAGTLSGGTITMTEIARFRNRPIALPTRRSDCLYWDILDLWESIDQGLSRIDALTSLTPTSIGVDTWGVDYALLGRNGELLANPSCYRCPRTDTAPEQFYADLARDEHYRRTGIQFQQFNTVFQLIAAAGSTSLQHAEQALLMPDLLTSWLGGEPHTDITNASTTALLDPVTRDWDDAVGAVVEKQTGRRPAELFAPLVEPGTVVGQRRDAQVGTVASHDTASAVVAVPTDAPNPYFISCGTWSLVGVERTQPLTSDAACAANMTNELGYGRTVRFLKNIMGLWVLNECARRWNDADIPILCAQAASIPAGHCVIPINDHRLFAPGDMPARIRAIAAEQGQPQPHTQAEVTRCIIDSLALAYRRALHTTEALTGTPLNTVHMVGGGINNTLLCQLTADATGIPVVAGPTEGTALGNLVVQAAATTPLGADREAVREIIRASVTTTMYYPRSEQLALWDRLDATISH